MSKFISKPGTPQHTEQVISYEYDKSNRSALKNVILTIKKNSNNFQSTEKENQKSSGHDKDCVNNIIQIL